MLAAQGNTPVPALPPAIWRKVLGFMTMPHLLRASSTCRLFAEILAERKREAVNTCLTAAEQEWAGELLQEFARAASLTRFGLDPFSLQLLPPPPPHAESNSVNVRHDLFVGPSAAGGQMEASSFVDEIPMSDLCALDSFIVCIAEQVPVVVVMPPVPNSRPDAHAPPAARMSTTDRITFRIFVKASHEEVRKAIGLLLAIARVERQQVVRNVPDNLRLEINPAWWMEDGILCVNLDIPAGVVVPALAHTAGECAFGKFERLDEQLFEGALSDVLGVAAALHMCLDLTLEQGDAVETIHFLAHSSKYCCCASFNEEDAN